MCEGAYERRADCQGEAASGLGRRVGRLLPKRMALRLVPPFLALELVRACQTQRRDVCREGADAGRVGAGSGLGDSGTLVTTKKGNTPPRCCVEGD